MGLPPPAEIGVSRYSAFFGAEPCEKFVTLRRAGDRPRLGTHITLAFDRPVEGPVLIGAGRYFGLGLLRPLRGPGEGDA